MQELPRALQRYPWAIYVACVALVIGQVGPFVARGATGAHVVLQDVAVGKCNHAIRERRAGAGGHPDRRQVPTHEQVVGRRRGQGAAVADVERSDFSQVDDLISGGEAVAAFEILENDRGGRTHQN